MSLMSISVSLSVLFSFSVCLQKILCYIVICIINDNFDNADNSSNNITNFDNISICNTNGNINCNNANNVYKLV